MFGWFTRAPKRTSAAMQAVFDEHFSPLVLCDAIASGARDYLHLCEAGSIRYPAATRTIGEPGSSVREIWEDSRLEAAISFMMQPNARLDQLASVVDQPMLFTSIIAQLAGKKLRPDPVHDNAKAVLVSGHYLWTQLCVAGSALTLAGDSYIAPALKAYRSAALEWTSFASSVTGGRTTLQPRPQLLVEVWWREVTVLSKEIGVAAIWGADFKRAIRDQCRRLQAKHGDKVDPTAIIERIEMAKKPDELYDGQIA